MSERRGQIPGAPSQPPGFEAMAHALVGRLVMVYSGLDSNLSVYVAGWRGESRRQESLVDLDNTSFKAKLDLVLSAVNQQYGGNTACVSDWQAWLETANRLRRRRNDLMHGRWGILAGQAVIINITGLPGLPSQHEERYSLESLSAEVDLAVQVADQFAALRNRWPL